MMWCINDTEYSRLRHCKSLTVRIVQQADEFMHEGFLKDSEWLLYRWMWDHQSTQRWSVQTRQDPETPTKFMSPSLSKLNPRQ